MQLNGVVFPAPECSYGIRDFPGELIFIPRDYDPNRKAKKSRSSHSQRSIEGKSTEPQSSTHVPCLFLPYYGTGSKLQNQNKTLVESEIGNLLNQNNDNYHIQTDRVQEHNETTLQWLPELLKTLEKRKQTKLLIFFHGNAEDIGIARTTLNTIKQSLKINILAVEYSGYGLFIGDKSADKLLEDCLSVYDYVHH